MKRTNIHLAVLLLCGLFSSCFSACLFAQQARLAPALSPSSDEQKLLQAALFGSSESKSPEDCIATSFFIGGNLWQMISQHEPQAPSLASGFLAENRPVFTPHDAKNILSTKALQDLLRSYSNCTPELARYDDLNPTKYSSFLPFASADSKSFSTFLFHAPGQPMLIVVLSGGKLVGIEIWLFSR